MVQSAVQVAVPIRQSFMLILWYSGFDLWVIVSMCSVVILSVYRVLKFDIDNSFKMVTQARFIIEADLDELDANDSDIEVDVRLVTDSGKVRDI